jgi:hypothetical protein
MLPRQLRVGDLVDDYCPRERRLSDHAIVAMVGEEVRQVRCTACAGEHVYRQGKVPASRKKKPLPLPPAASVAAPVEPPSDVAPDAPAADRAGTAPVPVAAALPGVDATQPEPSPEDAAAASESGAPQDGPFHRRLIRATLPRIEGAEVPPRPIPEFTMHKAAAAQAHRHGRPFRPGQPGGGQHRPGGKSGPGQARHGGMRHGQGPGNADGNSFGNRAGGRGGQGVPPGGPRHGFSHNPPRGPKKH